MNLVNTQNHFVEVELDGELQHGVNARELHKWLESKQDFSTWIKKRISQCKFEENYDFISIHKKMEREIGATTRIEYIISTDMAKHLAMMERTPQGHKVRKYYIEQEKILRNIEIGIQSQICKLSLQVDQLKDSLSEAGRFLNVGGKKIKPRLLKELDDLVDQAQHKLQLGE